jgi:hypothetical protein
MIGTYIMIAAWLIFAYLLFTNAKGATGLIGGLSSANTGAIKALQGR